MLKNKCCFREQIYTCYTSYIMKVSNCTIDYISWSRLLFRFHQNNNVIIQLKGKNNYIRFSPHCVFGKRCVPKGKFALIIPIFKKPYKFTNFKAFLLNGIPIAFTTKRKQLFVLPCMLLHTCFNLLVICTTATDCMQ